MIDGLLMRLVCPEPKSLLWLLPHGATEQNGPRSLHARAKLNIPLNPSWHGVLHRSRTFAHLLLLLHAIYVPKPLHILSSFTDQMASNAWQFVLGSGTVRNVFAPAPTKSVKAGHRGDASKADAISSL